MRVTVVGAGPSGLYLAILLKKADPAHEVTVVERNAPDATFGWGVVFSEETLGALRDADYATYLEITDSFARWTSIDIHYRGQVLRSSGHTFSAIKRTQLLDILQRRARALGVDLRFGTEVSTVDSADLVVAADGSNSTLRRGGDFGTTVEPQGCKYVWFGTDLVLDAFTFIFKETEHGLFQVHAYPFDEYTSTFIVETRPETWRRAGLDTMSEEESIAFCAALFADELGGHRLMSNKSIWLDFPLVRNKSWHNGNVVLIGDSAHTAHFSIGSGTKLAMEDAIALANSFVRHPGSVEPALTDYELERQPVVERFQQAAGDSAAYFGRVGHYTGLEPIQFAFNLLTRSGRISHANLTQRDPQLLRVLDAWFTGAAVPGSVAPPPMFAPLTIGGTTARNRVVRAGGDLAAAARTGAGLVLTGFVAVSADGRTTPSCPVLDDSWAPVVDKVHDAGALVGVRLGHAGRRGAVRESGVDVAAAGRVAAAVGVAAAVRAVRCGAAGDDAGRHGPGARRLRRGGLGRGRRRVRRAGAGPGRRPPAGELPVPADEPARRRVRHRAAAVPAVRCGRGARGVARGPAAGGAADRDRLGARRADRRGRHRARPRAGRARRRPGARAGRTHDGGLAAGVPARLPDDAVRPGAQRGRRADPGRRLPDHPGRGEHDRRRGPGGPVPVRTAAQPAGGDAVTAFADLTSPQVAELLAGPRTPVLLLPVGAVEPHGPHAPLGTDRLISAGMCARAAERLDGDPDLRVLVLPALNYGVTDMGAAFPGAISIGADTLRALVIDVCRALRDQGLRRIVVVNNHFEPAHVAALRAAVSEAGVAHLDLLRRANVARLTDEFRSGSCHAGQYETSLVLADRPELVDTAVMRELPHGARRHAGGDVRRAHGLRRDGHGPRLLRLPRRAPPPPRERPLSTH